VAVVQQQNRHQKKGCLAFRGQHSEDSDYEETESEDNDNNVETSNREDSVRVETVLKNREGEMIPAVTRDAVNMSSSSSSSSTSSRKATSKSMYASSLAKIMQLFPECVNKLTSCSYGKSDHKRFFVSLCSELKKHIVEEKKGIKPKKGGGNKPWDYMFESWLVYGTDFPERKNCVCIDTHAKLNNWVKEQCRKFKDGTLSKEHF